MLATGTNASAAVLLVSGRGGTQSPGTGESWVAAAGGVGGANCPEVSHEVRHPFVGEAEVVHVQYRLDQSCANQGISYVVHVQEAAHVNEPVGLSPGIPELPERVRAKGGKSQQPAWPEDTAKFDQDGIEIIAPLEHQVAEDQVHSPATERQGSRVCTDGDR
jgi:hypothetical protein